MKNIIAVLVIVRRVDTGSCSWARPRRPSVSILSPKSNLDTATVSEGFAKYCPNVVVTENESKADYVLEASSKMTYSDGTRTATGTLLCSTKTGMC